MTTLWERQVAHIDRRVRPLEELGLRRLLRKAAVRKRRGLPSRAVSLEATFELLDMELAARKGEPPDREALAKLQWRLIRERLLERKLAQRRAARHQRKLSGHNTKINLWRRRREWLREAEKAQRP